MCDPGQPCYANGTAVVNSFALENPTLLNCVIVNVALGCFFLICGLATFNRTSAPLNRLK
jgi:hypothetical protein